MLTMTEKEFNKKYPNWDDGDFGGKYYNLPKEKFLLIGESVSAKKIIYVAIDNSDYCCYVEDFETLAEALAYLNNEELAYFNN